MRKILTVTAISLALASGAVQAQKPAPAQDKLAMASACEKLAGSKKGEERKSFLASCVSARSTTQHSGMTSVSSKSSCHHGSAEDL